MRKIFLGRFFRLAEQDEGDGNFGGFYQRPDDEMLALWEVAIAETRALIEEGWD